MSTPFKKKFMRVPDLHLSNAFREIGRNAYVDWILVLIASLVTAICLTTGGLYLYWQISSGNFKGEEITSDSPKKIFDEKLLNEVVSQFDNKEEKLLELKNGYSGPPDPSK
jgi:hypothetical protein